MRLSATLAHGGAYENDDCFVLALENGLIRRVREYMGTAKGHRMILHGSHGEAAPRAFRPQATDLQRLAAAISANKVRHDKHCYRFFLDYREHERPSRPRWCAVGEDRRGRRR